mmetsp:Transcript_6369/g.9008  ORF Transcript_6369/g.9008 Transcript_6369/m.9008 type:complete len:164 (+) Transcript_6369:190-681(+)
MCSVFSSLLGAIFFATATKSFSFSHCCRRSSSYISSTALRVSELHIPGYAQTKLPFILKDEDLIVEAGGQPTLTRVDEREYRDEDYSSLIPYETGHLLHKTTNPIFQRMSAKGLLTRQKRLRQKWDGQHRVMEIIQQQIFPSLNYLILSDFSGLRCRKEFTLF